MSIVATLIVLLIQMAEPLCWEWFWGKIANPREKRKKYRWIGLVLMCLHIPVLGIFSSMVSGIRLFPYLLNNLSIFLFIFYGFFFWDISFKKAMGYVMALFIMGAFTEYFVTQFLLYGLGKDSETIKGSASLMVISMLLLRGLNWYYQYITYRIRKKQGRFIECDRIFYFVVAGYVLYFGAFGTYYNLVADSDLFCGLMFFLELFIGLCGIFYVVNVNRIEANYESVVQYSRSQIAMLQKIQEHLDTNQKIIHDIKNDLCVIVQLLENERIEDAKNYISKLLPSVKGGSAIGLGSSVIAIILYSKRITAKENFIDLQCAIEVSHIDIPIVELNSIISNMLDNAIEACNKIRNRKKRKITFKVYIVEEHVVIECENTYTGRITLLPDGTIGTSKKDKRNHGLGLGRIEECATKNGGGFLCEYTQDTFMVKVQFNKAVATIEEE